jgi:glycosyltransferase involved in cell wall biosynthesis
MAGPSKKPYMDMLLPRLQAFGKEIASRVVWTGKLEGDMKWGAFRGADAFVFPSHTENFGMVVAESLACGTPVLTTRRVGIWREVTEEGAGWAESDDTEGVERLLRRWRAFPSDERRAMRLRARDCFERRFEIKRAAQALIDVLQEELRN